MRETPLSNCERDFILKAVTEQKRYDGRLAYDYRKIKISFGSERGSCQVQLGETRVFAKVSSEITAPKPTRPTDGVLFINVELSPMASPSFEPGRPSEFNVEMTRLLERCLKESRCIDTESLCIVAGEKVWTIRIDIHALNYEGNLLDCASIAAISALSHFRRQDITVSGEEVTVHSVEERDPVALSIHHMPLCCTFAFFTQGKHLLVDPSLVEEKVMDGKMVIGMNKHREICMLQITGQMLLLKEQVLRCSNIAVVKVAEITELIQKALQNDKEARAAGEKFGFAESSKTQKITTTTAGAQEMEVVEVDDTQGSDEEEETLELHGSFEEPDVQILDKGLAAIGEGGENTWEMDTDAEQQLVSEAKSAVKSSTREEAKSLARPRGDRQPECIEIDDDSEEEDVITLSPADLHSKQRVPSPVEVCTTKARPPKGKGKKKK